MQTRPVVDAGRCVCLEDGEQMAEKIRVLPIDFRPSGIPKWNNTHDLIDEYCVLMAAASHEIVDYSVLPTVVVDDFPILENGEKYTAEHYNLMREGKQKPIEKNGSSALASYPLIVKQFGLDTNVGIVFDEVWLFGGGWFGYYESRMVGRFAYWVNSPGLAMCCKPFIMMGFNWERDVYQMIHAFGHRAENIIARHYGETKALRWCYKNDPGQYKPKRSEQFGQYLQKYGTIHKVPGGEEYSQEPTVFRWLEGMKPEWWRLAARV